jgi:hypothetical protein
MAEEPKNRQESNGEPKPHRGRPKKLPKLIRKTSAEAVLAAVDEKRMWLETLTMFEHMKQAFYEKTLSGSGEKVLVAMDPNYLIQAMKVRLDALKYLTDRRDGKAPLGKDDDGNTHVLRVLIETVGASPNGRH